MSGDRATTSERLARLDPSARRPGDDPRLQRHRRAASGPPGDVRVVVDPTGMRPAAGRAAGPTGRGSVTPAVRRPPSWRVLSAPALARAETAPAAPDPAPDAEALQAQLAEHGETLVDLQRRVLDVVLAAPAARPVQIAPVGAAPSPAAVAPLRPATAVPGVVPFPLRPVTAEDDAGFHDRLRRVLGESSANSRPAELTPGRRWLTGRFWLTAAILGVALALFTVTMVSTFLSAAAPTPSQVSLPREDYDRLRVQLCQQGAQIEDLKAQLQGRKSNPLAGINCP